MKRSLDRVLTTHTGSLPRPPAILEVMRSREAGAAIDERAFDVGLKAAVAGIVRQQAEAGIAVVNDGECGKPSFGNYVLERLTGFEARVRPSDSLVGRLTSRSRDRAGCGDSRPSRSRRHSGAARWRVSNSRAG
jgi:methionine synthase II (cobalamin-independent)